MMNLIKRRECLDKYTNFPNIDYSNDRFFYPEVFVSYIFTLNSKSIQNHIKNLALEITQMMGNLGCDKLTFLGNSKIPWLYQENLYEPVHDAIKYLVFNKIRKRFNGAIEVNVEELPCFLKHLSWLIRCNASLPNFYFMNETQDFLGSICKYGNLHLDILNEETNKRIENVFSHCNFHCLSDKSDCGLSSFSTIKGKIKGRQIVL